MSEAIKPTPVPYAVGKNGFENYVITNGLDKIIASLNPMGSLTEEESKATAEFVVCACNAYADMVKALESISKNMEDEDGGTTLFSDQLKGVLAALAKAEIQ